MKHKYNKIQKGGAKYMSQIINDWVEKGDVNAPLIFELFSVIPSVVTMPGRGIILPTIPDNVKILYINRLYQWLGECYYDVKISDIQLPSQLEELYFEDCLLNELPKLPPSLKVLSYKGSRADKSAATRQTGISKLENLPPNLIKLRCDNSLINYIDKFPETLQEIHLSDNKITTLPKLPDNLLDFSISSNKIDVLESLPATLKELHCDDCNLSKLPELPNTLIKIVCSNNRITTLPLLPSSITHLYCSNNNITTLPLLPSTLEYLDCEKNKLPNEYYQMNIDANPNMYYHTDQSKYIKRLRQIQQFYEIRNLPSNARNYIDYENIKNSNKMVNLPRINDKYNSNFKEYMKYNSWTYLPKKYENPMSKKKFTNKNLKFYTAKIKRNNNSGKRAKIERTRKNR